MTVYEPEMRAHLRTALHFCKEASLSREVKMKGLACASCLAACFLESRGSNGQGEREEERERERERQREKRLRKR
jgi:hypothetical protein